MPKLSRYNHFRPLPDGRYIAYNAFAGTVALMTAENYRMYSVLAGKLSSGLPEGLSDEEKELLKNLEYGHFVCPDNFDELVEMRFRHNIDKYDLTTLDISFAPTMACNMACRYCYESEKAGRMSPEVIKASIDLVARRAPKIKKLDVGWYGGEPLLAMDIIEELSESFLKISEHYNLEYGAAIITNGYLMTPDVSDRLHRLKVSSAQVSLDGPPETHHKKRPLKNGKPSFDTILDNICYAADKMRISLRINVDKDYSRETIAKLLGIIKDAGLTRKVSVHFGQVNVAMPVCANISETCYDVGDFARVEVEYYRMLLEAGFEIDKIPRPKSLACMAQNVTSCLIDPGGEIYRCFLHPGDKSKSMGNICDKINYQHPNFRRMFEIDPFADPLCADCGFLPTCLGGCPSHRAYDGMAGEKLCQTWKHNLDSMLEIIVEAKIRELQKAQARQAPGAAVRSHTGE